MKPTDLRGILQYVPRFRERIFVISMDGAVVTNENFSNILLDVAVLRSLNIRVVLVHGASAYIQELAQEKGITASNLDGSGVVDDETLALSLIASNRLTHEVMEGLSTNSLRAATTNAVSAYPLGILNGVDHFNAGKVERVDIKLLQTLLEQHTIPVLPPLGFDGDGNTYRVNSDHIAGAVANALKAIKVIYITTVDGLIWRGQLLRQVLVSSLDEMLARHRDDFHPSILSKAIHASASCRAGVPRVHIINGQVEEGLLAEVFSNEGVGTLIYGNEYQEIRPAMKKDIRNIMRLTKNSVASAELVKRNRSAIEKNLSDYYIFEIDDNPVGCVALHVYEDQKKAELAYLYVNPSHENQGIGRRLIKFVENKARDLGLNKMITLSTQAFTYFQSKGGFREGTPEDLPPSRRDQYRASGRNSKVLVKELGKNTQKVPEIF